MAEHERRSGIITSEPVPETEEVITALEQQIVQLAEANEADRKLLARRIEDLSWELMGQREKFDGNARGRANLRKRAMRYWQEDPVIGQSVDLLTRYTIGRGVPMPDIPEPPQDPKQMHRGTPEEMAKKTEDRAAKKAEDYGTMTPAEVARFNQAATLKAHKKADLQEADGPLRPALDDIIKPKDITDAQHEKATDALSEFWEAAENMAVLTSPQAQREKSTELQLDGEVFFAIFENGSGPVLLGDIDPVEITQVIPRTNNAKVPIWYERTTYPERYDYQNRQWVPDKDGEAKITYYQHWLNEPEADDPEPPSELVDPKARIYHVSVNKVSRQQRGNSELKRVVEWARGFHEYMESRLSIARAVNRVAQRVVVDGGPTEVARVMQQFSSGDSLALKRVPYQDVENAAPEAGTMFHNPQVKLEPSNFETGGSVANADKKAFLGMISSGVGWPMHYLGDEGAASLSTLTSMEMPLLKMVEDRQELWSGVISDLCFIALKAAGVAVRPSVTMPQVLQRDIGLFSAAILAIKQALDPSGQNVPLLRWMLKEALGAFGERDPARVVEEIFPDDYEPPAPPPPPGMGGAGPGEPGGNGLAPPGQPPPTNKGSRTAQGARDALATRGQ